MHRCLFVCVVLGLYVHRSVCMGAFLSVCPYVYMPSGPYTRMPVCLCVRMFICPHVRMHGCLYMCLYVFMHTGPYVRMPVCLCVCMSICPQVRMHIPGLQLYQQPSVYFGLYVWSYVIGKSLSFQVICCFSTRKYYMFTKSIYKFIASGVNVYVV